MASRDKKPAEKKEESAKSEIMQRLKTHPFLFIGTVVVLVIVIVAFVFVPAIVPSAQRGTELIFGYYNKIPIKYVPGNYFHQVQYQLTQQMRLSQDDPNYMSRMGQVWAEAFAETAVHIGILDEMKQAGYIAPENVVDREVALLPDFQENGRFSAARYRTMDNNSRMNLWRQTQENITVGMYVSDMENLNASSKEARFVTSMSSPKRTFDLAAFPISLYPDSEIVSYAESNRDLFKTTRLSRITVTSGEREAKQIYESVKNGVSTFEEMAKTNSGDMYADRGGDMGLMMAFELRYEISDDESRNRVINLARGELSDIIKVPSGWAFFRAEEASYAANLNDEAVKTNIRNYMMENERGRAEDWLIAEAEKFIRQAEEKGFNEAAGDGNVTKRSLGPISLNFGNILPFGSLASAGVPELTGAGSNQFFWKLAFSTPLNTISAPLVVGDSVIVLLPREENEDESDEDYIAMFSSYWINWMRDITNNSAKARFLTSDKLENNFDETFMSLWAR